MNDNPQAPATAALRRALSLPRLGVPMNEHIPSAPESSTSSLTSPSGDPSDLTGTPNTGPMSAGQSMATTEQLTETNPSVASENLLLTGPGEDAVPEEADDLTE